MKWQLIIAWRNLWRNTRRTAVILVSIIVGIWMMLLLGAIMWVVFGVAFYLWAPL